MSTDLVQMVWMAQPPIAPGQQSRVRKIPADSYWYMAHTFTSHAEAFQWAYWKAYEDRTAEDRIWVARFTDFAPMNGYTLDALQAARSHMSESIAIGNWRRGV